MKQSLIFLVLTALLASCSIEKRRYTSGYYLAWNHKKQVPQPTSQHVQSLATKSIQLPKITAPAEPEIKLSAMADNSVSNSSRAITNISNQHRAHMPSVKINRPKTLVVDPLVNHPKATWSLILGIAAMLVPFGGLACGILAIVFGVKGKKAIAAEPDKYNGMGMAKAGFILGIVACALWVVVLILL